MAECDKQRRKRRKISIKEVALQQGRWGRWPCKLCGKEPFGTVWHIGDEDATSIFDTATRICDPCYTQHEVVDLEEEEKEEGEEEEEEAAADAGVYMYTCSSTVKGLVSLKRSQHR